VFVDSTARHAVDYLYHVVVEAAGLELVSATHEGRLTLSSVEITRADFESRKASATLEWTVFDGPRFDSYEVWRTVGANSQRIGVIGDADSTGLVDRGLRGSTQYNYQVRVRTRREEEIPSLMRSGGFHGLVAEWGLDLEGTSSLQVFVRLSGRSGGGVDALTTVSQAEIRRVEFDGEGQVLQSRQVGDILNLFRGRTIRASIPALLVQTARQLLSVADALVGAGVMALTSGGEEQLVEETTLDLDMSDGTEHNRVSSNLEIEIDGGWYTIDVQCLDLAGWTNRVRQSNGHDSLTTPYLQNSPPRLNLPVVYQG
jgi:hypothetical protein